MAKIIFFQAHPDDLEAYSSLLLHHLSAKSDNKHDIRIASMTRGEFGLFGYKSEAFKGERLGRIRTYEQYRAMEFYGIKREQIDFFEILDGSVKFTRKIISKVVEYLNEHKPDILFAPEPLWTFYTHKDHVITGRILYYIIDKKLIEKIPKLFYYTSILSNYKFPFKAKDYEFKERVIECHHSQKKLFDELGGFLKLWQLGNARWLRGWRYAENFRKVYFGEDAKLNRKPTLAAKLVSGLMLRASFKRTFNKIYIIDQKKIQKQGRKK